MTLSLVILAAGAGSRFGGKKQVHAVGPTGQVLFEYSVFDALLAGFERFIFVVDDTLDTNEIARRLQAMSKNIKVDYVVQELSAYTGNHMQRVQSRSKPWGTAHAVLAAKPFIRDMYAVINADDFYARPVFSLIAKYLRKNRHNPSTGVMPGFELCNTLSESGGVNRGICTVDRQGYLRSIREVRNIRRDQQGVFSGESAIDDLNLTSDSVVSMTFWGFHPSSLSWFEKRFSAFLSNCADNDNAEFYIPAVVDFAINKGLTKVRVLPVNEAWMGMTYKDDVDEVRRRLQIKTQNGVYPQHFGSVVL